MKLGKRIAEIRKEHKLTQEGLAEICSVTRQTISAWENDKSYPDIHSLLMLGDLFHVSLDTLVKGDIEIMKEILQSTFTTLKPSDYQISVREITLDDVTVDKDKEIATYIDPDGPDYIIKDNGEKVSISPGRLEINDRDYYRLLTTGHVYEVILTTDKYYDTYLMGGSDRSNTLEITVERSNINFNADNVSKRVSMICSEDFDKIIDAKSKSIVWKADN